MWFLTPLELWLLKNDVGTDVHCVVLLRLQGRKGSPMFASNYICALARVGFTSRVSGAALAQCLLREEEVEGPEGPHLLVALVLLRLVACRAMHVEHVLGDHGVPLHLRTAPRGGRSAEPFRVTPRPAGAAYVTLQ